jgi:nitronate monooxygenase
MFPGTRLTKLLGIKYPIICAPMVGASTPELAAAVSNAGGLGSLAVTGLSPEAIHQTIAEVRRRTSKPFNVNLLVLETPNPDPRQIARAIELLQPIREELGLPPGQPLEKYGEDNEAQFEALLKERPAVASFAFGLLTKTKVAALKAGGTLVMGTVTNVAEAKAWEEAGADAVCAQGSEAGGHRGTFIGDFESSMVGTLALVPQVVNAVRVPVIAAGGIMDGRGIAAALVLGASCVQMGTAFLICPESNISKAWRSALLQARDDQTRISRIYSGRHARGIANEFMRKLTPVADEIPPFPIQNALTFQIRQTAAKANRPEYLSLWAGQGVAMSRGLPAAELFSALVQETKAALRMAEQARAADR